MGRRFNRKRKPKHMTRARYIKVEYCNYIAFAKGDCAKRSGRSWFSFKFKNVKYKQKRRSANV